MTEDTDWGALDVCRSCGAELPDVLPSNICLSCGAAVPNPVSAVYTVVGMDSARTMPIETPSDLVQKTERGSFLDLRP